VALLLGGIALIAPPGASAAPLTDPPGNNGFIKVEQVDFESLQPENNPHQGCAFVVEFYNYDEGDYNATVTFEDYDPTSPSGLKVASGNLTPFIGGDAASGGTDQDAKEIYTLSFTGEPHPQQGYHVKLTINAPGSIGSSDVKHKTFWVEGCAPIVDPIIDPIPTPSVLPIDPTPSMTPPTTPLTPPAVQPIQPTTTPSPTPTVEPTVQPTEQPSAPAGSPQPTASESPTAAVPTEIDAGTGGDTAITLTSGGPGGLGGLGIGLVGGGALLVGGAAAVALRRRSRHSI
jgi:hypothetical protein